MANIAISELLTETNVLKDNDYLLVSSKNANGSFTSAKMLGSALKSTIAAAAASTGDIDAQYKFDQIIDKLNSMDTSYNSYFGQILDLTTRIGNNVYNPTGQNKTLTLTYNAQNWGVSAPTSYPAELTQPSGTRFNITAQDPIDPGLVKWDGWYYGDALIDNGIQKSVSYELLSDITLNAKYSLTGKIRAKFNVVNNSSFTFNNWLPGNNGQIEPGTSRNVSTILTNSASNYTHDDISSINSSYDDTYNKINVTCSNSAISLSLKKVIFQVSIDAGAVLWSIKINVPSSASIENYDGTYKDYGTITITNK